MACAKASVYPPDQEARLSPRPIFPLKLRGGETGDKHHDFQENRFPPP